MTTANPLIQRQHDVSRRLHLGIIFSLVWLFGVGSLYSFVQGVLALKAIRESGHQLHGSLRAWWCILVGGLGALFLLWCAVTLILYLMGIEGH